MSVQTSESPFIFGRKAVGDSFTDRENETARLVANFKNRVNTVLISPRRWGKSSLVKRAGDLSQSDSMKVIYIDAFSLRDATEFYTELATEVIKGTSNTIETWVDHVKRFFSRLSPRFSFGSDPLNSFELSFELESMEKNYQEILDLPERIASEKGIMLVVCIDEFQDTANFNESALFHKRLRAAWQNHQSVTYCIYGSKQHMMSTLFEKQSMPFYKFGENIYLRKIPVNDWVLFIIQKFAQTGKKINESIAQAIPVAVKCHSYYVQQLSHLVWQRTLQEADDFVFTAALDDLLSQNDMLYQRETELLSDTQLNFLKAIASGIVSGFSNKETLLKFGLGSSANVNKIKKALVDKEFVEFNNNSAEFLDPAYELWFIRTIMKIKNRSEL
ncbi:MAG: ATP-binding protein [Bacteroidales bacterium]|nr:ATP-binding protein [Bacteroidales bacterium]